MKKLSLNLQDILYYIILILPLVLVKQITVLGGNALPLFIIAAEVFLICQKILENKGERFVIRKYSMDKYICFFILVYALWKIVSFLLGIFSNGLLDMEFYTTILSVTILYLVMDFQIIRYVHWMKIAAVTGSIGSAMILLTCINGIEASGLTDALTVTNDGIVSYLLLVTVISMMNWIMTDENGKWSSAWLLPIGFNMFVLLLKQSHIGNWVIVLMLLSIASFFRPRATLIKKIGILLFMFLFLWSNMSLVLNYTKWFNVTSVYSLEASVYMELFLAMGGLLFFHFWDKLPENMDLYRISMVKMQVYFKMVLGVMSFSFLTFIAGGTIWQSLPEEGLKGFVRVLALPLSTELTGGSSTIFVWISELGVVIVLLVLIWFYEMGSKLGKKCGIDREKNNCFFLLYVLFLISFFLWELPCNVLVVYLFLFSMGLVKSKITETDMEEIMSKDKVKVEEK